MLEGSKAVSAGSWSNRAVTEDEIARAVQNGAPMHDRADRH